MFRFARCAAVGIALLLSAGNVRPRPISQSPRDHHRAARGRQRHGRAGAALCRQAVAGSRQAGGRGEPSRRLADARRECGRAIAARRPHAAGLHLVRDGDQSHAVQAGDLRAGSRLHSDLALREVAVHPGGQSGRPGEDRSGADRVHQGEPGQAQLFLARRRRRAAPVDGIHEEPVRPGDHPCAVPLDAAIDPGHRGRPRGARLGRGRRVDPADQGGQAARARGLVHDAAAAACPTCRRSPRPRPRRASRRCRGTCCSRRRKPRATSSTGCTPT